MHGRRGARCQRRGIAPIAISATQSTGHRCNNDFLARSLVAGLPHYAGREAMFTVTVFGGSGFLGRRLVRRLVAEGAAARVVVRHAQQAPAALHAEGLDAVGVFRADVRDPNSLVAALAGTDAVVNAVSGYVEKRGVTFEAIHVQGAEAVARRAAEANLTRFVLISQAGRPDDRQPAAAAELVPAAGLAGAGGRPDRPGR